MMTDEEKDDIERHAQMTIMEYLIGVAQKTQGAEVWRALFAEILARLGIGNAIK